MLVSAIFTVAFVRFRDLSFYGALVETFAVASVLALIIATPWGVLVTKEDASMNIKNKLQYTWFLLKLNKEGALGYKSAWAKCMMLMRIR